jgi:phosphate-selective porin OprO and OprP
MRKPISRLRIGPTLGPWLAALVTLSGPCGLVHGQLPGPLLDPPQATALEARLRRVEEVNARLLEQLKSDREESARRYGALEDRYRELQRRLGEPRPAAEAEATPAPGETTTRSSHLGRPGEVGRPHPTREVPLRPRLADGFQLASEDDEFDLRFHVLDQTDFKLVFDSR